MARPRGTKNIATPEIMRELFKPNSKHEVEIVFEHDGIEYKRWLSQRVNQISPKIIY